MVTVEKKSHNSLKSISPKSLVQSLTSKKETTKKR